jgi:hypothetical protein
VYDSGQSNSQVETWKSKTKQSNQNAENSEKIVLRTNMPFDYNARKTDSASTSNILAPIKNNDRIFESDKTIIHHTTGGRNETEKITPETTLSIHSIRYSLEIQKMPYPSNPTRPHDRSSYQRPKRAIQYPI